MFPEQALGLQFARATPVKGGPAVRLAGVAEAGVAQRQAPQLAVPAGEGRDELSLQWRVCRVVGRNVRYAGFEQLLGLLAQARAIPPPPGTH